MRLAVLFRIYAHLTLLMVSSQLQAHDTNIATFQIEHVGENQWLYRVMAPRHALDQSLAEEYTQQPEILAEIDKTSTQYKELMVAHIKRGFRLNAEASDAGDGVQIALGLGQGRINLAPHMSVLIFEIKGMPDHVQSMSIQLSTMANNPQQTNVLNLVDGERRTRHILNADNQFQVTDHTFFSHLQHTE